MVVTYEVTWSTDQCPDLKTENSNITDNTSYTILNLRPGTNYTLFVTATNSAGKSSSETATVETEEESELIVKSIFNKQIQQIDCKFCEIVVKVLSITKLCFNQVSIL